ncbi:MAG: hypothetical protein WBD10_10015 [Acidobacteriaceae bacterium]
MPVLNPQAALPSARGPARRAGRTFPQCANPRCASGWLHLWRKRGAPVIEGGWLCSPACTRARVEDLLRRERAEAHPPATYRHRIPIGLVLLEQGWITHEQLKDALEAQRAGAGMRLGEWLTANRGLDEVRLTQALGLQWSCPVFSLDKHAAAFPVTAVPRILAESFGFVPLRLTSSGILYLAFEDRIDHSLALAIERVTRLRVESGLLSGSEFRQAQERHRQGRFPRARMIEAGTPGLLAEAFAGHIEKEKPSESRLVRLHDLFWLRLWAEPDEGGEAEDVIGSVVRFT